MNGWRASRGRFARVDRRCASTARPGSAGVSVMELLVAMAVGLVVVLAVSSVLLRSEGRNRGSMAVNDINQAGAYGAYLLDQAVRSAGSGFANRWTEVYGCRLNATRGGTAWLPSAVAWPEPFAGFTQSPRMAPVLIGKGQSKAGSDVIMVMNGGAGFGEAPLEVLALGPPLGVRNTLGLDTHQLLLLADGQNDCLLLQTGTPASDTLPLTGTGRFHTTSGTHRSLGDFAPPSTSTVAVNLGNVGASGSVPRSPPQWVLLGVGDNRTLFALDLLGIERDTAQPILEGVVEMRALYGVDTDGNGVLDGWRDPGTAPFNTASLLAGTPTAQTNLNAVIALRVGLVLRSAQAEREVVAPESIVLFADLDASLQQTRTLSTADKNYRHRSVEITIPLRNVLLARGL